MDYDDKLAGADTDFFWFKGKLGLIRVLMAKLKTYGSPGTTATSGEALGKPPGEAPGEPHGEALGKPPGEAPGEPHGEALKVLSLGCGTGEEVGVLRNFGNVYSIDIDENALKLVPEGLCVEKRLGDATEIPYPDNFFDIVAAFDILEHVKDDARAAGEVSRVLKDEGFFVLTVPAFQALFGSHDRALSHYRRYSKKTLRERLSGFRTVELGFWMCALFPPVALARLRGRKQTEDKVHYTKLPTAVNSLFYGLVRIENWLIRHNIPLPVGTSIYGIFQNRKRS